MDYQWAKTRVLQLIDRYSSAGSPVSLTYSDQADFVVKIPGLLNEGEMVLAATVRKMRKSIPLSRLESREEAGIRRYKLPEDCLEVSGLADLVDGTLCRWGDIRTVEDGWIVPVPAPKGEVLMEYYRRPRLLGETPEPEDELDNAPEAQMALPYYAAAQLLLMENTHAYQALLNQWELRLSRLALPPRAEMGLTENAYAW